MPNWAEGSLKIRGTREDIIKFLKGALQPLLPPGSEIAKFMGKEVENPTAEITENESYFEMKNKNGFHIKGTHRAFIEQNIDWWFQDKHSEILVIDNFKQAWGVDAGQLAELSKVFNVDIKIHAFERGMEFNQEIEIHKGDIIKDDEIQFKDYDWDCVFPNLGG
ncbi:hypothetical protein [Cytobacillus oceanisediminis]|uniref:hypothetical protein n=1 Tax=Cytobacillus oceanisediminis TaxID=665099 RepID=UPI002079DA43|nr:hypothetical protein [Cytobacillus oceanisediminis]USK43555.1 hypothetical protein LIT27_23690 [Cytobacillus oceanisediminis]